MFGRWVEGQRVDHDLNSNGEVILELGGYGIR